MLRDLRLEINIRIVDKLLNIIVGGNQFATGVLAEFLRPNY